MSRSKKNNNPAEDLMATLLKDVVQEKSTSEMLDLSELKDNDFPEGYSADEKASALETFDATKIEDYVSANATSVSSVDNMSEANFLNPSASSLLESISQFKFSDPEPSQQPQPQNNATVVMPEAEGGHTLAMSNNTAVEEKPLFSDELPLQLESEPSIVNPVSEVDSFFKDQQSKSVEEKPTPFSNDDKTVAVTGYQNLNIENHDDKVKVSIGQNKSAYSTGYVSWGGEAEASLGQAENLRIAQEKILELERENEKLRLQNDELISASEIIKERSDLLSVQITEFKNDKEGLEESFKNEVALLKGHLHRKEVELQKAQIKIDDLDSRLKFDMKKIRIRERELENRLELIRAEKNAVTKSKDEQILDLRRKMDVLQMEVESYRQKCVDLNKLLENNQDSFKRTTRALRLAMANLELQEENKASVNVALKKVD